MDPATIGAVVTTVGPLLIKCGELIFKRYGPELAAEITKEGCAAVGKKAGGDGLLGRIGESTGRAFGWVAALFVADKSRPMVNEAAESLAGAATSRLLGAAAEVATKAAHTYVAKKLEAPDAKEQSDLDEKIKQAMLKHMETKVENKQIKSEILKLKLDEQKLKNEQRRAAVEWADEKRRAERESWKLSTEKPVIALPERLIDATDIETASAAAA